MHYHALQMTSHSWTKVIIWFSEVSCKCSVRKKLQGITIVEMGGLLGGPLGHWLLPGEGLAVKVAGETVLSELVDQSLHLLLILLLDLSPRLSPKGFWDVPRL